MDKKQAVIHQQITELADIIGREETPDPQHYLCFLKEPENCIQLIDLFSTIDADALENHRAYYSACVFAIEVSVAQLQVAIEKNQKQAKRILNNIMSHLTRAIHQSPHDVSFWLPVLNAFYEVHVELTPELAEAYFSLSLNTAVPEDESQIESIEELLEELSDLTVYEKVDHFFSHTYAMPAEFFSDLVIDLAALPKGEEIAILLLLHEKEEAREVVVGTLNEIIHHIEISSASLTRLKMIQAWYPNDYHALFDDWIKIQRKKGVIFASSDPSELISVKASEIDGFETQGIFFHFRRKRQHRLGGILLKKGIGIKDAWTSTPITLAQIAQYNSAFDNEILITKTTLEYVTLVVNHFMAKTLEVGKIPPMQLLEIQEELHLKFTATPLALDDYLSELGIQIMPFTPDIVHQSLLRSNKWPVTKRFTDTWYIEGLGVDSVVNQHSCIVEGIRVCNLEEAIHAIFQLENQKRGEWTYNFLWITLWLQSTKQLHKYWQDAFIITYCFANGTPLEDIPIMWEIFHQTIANSIETMQERKTHLSAS